MEMQPGRLPVVVDLHDSPLGRWRMARWTAEEASSHPRGPGGAFAGMGVEGIWAFDGSLTLLRERHFPQGTVELIVHLGERYGHVEPLGVEPYPVSCLTGLLDGPDVVEAPPGRQAVVGIRLAPLGAWRLLGLPLHELGGRTEDLADLLPRDRVRALEDTLDRAPGVEGQVRAAARWLAGSLRHRVEPGVAWATERIRLAGGALRVGALRDRVEMSRNRFHETFRAQVGTTPKGLARLLRFRRALPRVGLGGASLAEVALSCGYYDQAHMTNEFRSLAGISPRGYARALRFPGSESVAEGGG